MFRKILVIGSYPYINRPNTIGGATSLVKSLLDYLSNKNIKYYFISSNIFGFKFSYIINYLNIILRAFLFIPLSKNVIINCSKNGTFYLFPLIFIICKIFNKKIIFRMFGGNFISLYEKSNYISNFFLFHCLKNCDIIFFETKYIIKYCKKIFPKHKNILWFPNVRASQNINNNVKYEKRFVFMSHIKFSKGIENIIEVANLLSEDYIFDFYGPIIDNKYNSEYISSMKNCNYLGILKGDDVQEKLKTYSIVLLPTFYEGEGYPGIIIEAFSLGLPVIATNLKGISEIVENNKSGLLVPIKDSNKLYEAIISINDNNYKAYSKNAIIAFDNFNSDSIYPKIINYIDKSII